LKCWHRANFIYLKNFSTNSTYLKLFFAEAKEKLVALDAALIALEKHAGNVDAANEAMRAAHTLKSSAAAMGLSDVSSLSHAMEDAFERVRSTGAELDRQTLQLLFQGTDALRSSVDAFRKDDDAPDLQELINALRTQDAATIGSVNRDPTTSKIEDRISHVASLEPIEAIRVDVGTLDALLNITEELLVARLNLSEIVRVAREEERSAVSFTDIQTLSETFNRLLDDLQYFSTQIRTVPIAQVTERFPRIVRDLASTTKKEVALVMRGQEIDLDRTVIDRIGEPLLHLLRNAIDHGIREKGTVILEAERMHDRVVISIEDDGPGIDWPAVVVSAATRGIITKEASRSFAEFLATTLRDTDTSALSEQIENRKSKIVNLLFHPQLSTKAEVSETSGRGVGLAIVKSAVEALSGTVTIESPVRNPKSDSSSSNRTSNIANRTFRGTRITLSFPLTLAIIPSLIVEVAGQRVAIPFSQVDRSVRISAKSIRSAFDTEVAVVDDEDIPMVRLAQHFGLSHAPTGGAATTAHHDTIKRVALREQRAVVTTETDVLMVVTLGEHAPRVGLVVDALIAEQDIVVKPMRGALRTVPGFAGITILGDGKPALILDMTTLL
jgi:two-component system, chemotaxis family, sensor kinase CheA